MGLVKKVLLSTIGFSALAASLSFITCETLGQKLYSMIKQQEPKIMQRDFSETYTMPITYICAGFGASAGFIRGFTHYRRK